MNKIKVARKAHYFCVIATKKILKGEIILKLQGNASSFPDKYSIQTGEKEHLFPFSENPQDESSAFRFINHSCSPNSYFDVPNKSLIALKDIDINEEVFFHYCSTEYEMASPFQCLCGTADCLIEIKGFRYLSAEKKKELSNQLAPHLKKLEHRK
ncbi:MAG: SET domain-containing protein [Bacteroidetes bacterium]|nr:SET domain-containing protein [Bacteroidota bacterium]